MSVESHLAELERRHEALKREIQEAQSHPGFDDIEIASLSPSCRDGGGGGCCSASANPLPSLLLALAVVLLVRRRAIIRAR